MMEQLSWLLKNSIGGISLSCLPQHCFNPPLSIYSRRWDANHFYSLGDLQLLEGLEGSLGLGASVFWKLWPCGFSLNVLTPLEIRLMYCPISACSVSLGFQHIPLYWCETLSWDDVLDLVCKFFFYQHVLLFFLSLVSSVYS